MTKHTPGPWHVSPIRVMDGKLAICERSGVTVAVADDEANARLIAEIPDLLAALEAMEKYAVAIEGPRITGIPAMVIADASAAIARAKVGM